MKKVLARSENYKITAEHETINLKFGDGRRVTIGDFYGDPAAAIIDFEERWAIMVGCGLILYYLREPYQPYEYNMETDQWVEKWREPDNVWWIESVYQLDDDTVRFVVDPLSPAAAIYEMRLPSLEVRKI